MTNPQIMSARFTDKNGGLGVALGFGADGVASLRAGEPVLIDLAALGVADWPLTIVDGEWMAAHADMGVFSPGPRLDLTAEDFQELAAGRPARRSTEASVLWPAITFVLLQAATAQETPDLLRPLLAA